MALRLPPIEEQRRIAAILDKADDLRAKRRAALTHLSSLTQSIFLDVFGEPATEPHPGWKTVPMRSLVVSASYGTSERASAAGSVPVLRMGNLSSTGRVELDDLKFMELPPDQFERLTVRRGDLLFNRTDSAQLVGKTAVYRGDTPMAYAGYLVRLRLDEPNDPEYPAALLNTKWAKTTFQAMCKSIVGMANINANELQNIVVMRPPSEAQKEFGKIVAEVLSREGLQHEALAAHESLFSSLQQRAFSGAL